MRLSLDKIVFVIKYPFGKLNLEEVYNTLCLEKDSRIMGDLKFYDCNFIYKDKAFISFNPKVKGDDNFPDDSLRFEYNPNKLDVEELKFILGKLPKKEHVRYNRVDFALDIQKEILPQFFFDKNKRNSHYYFVGADCETSYIGSQLSDIQYRIYDKRKEILKDEGLLHTEHETLEKDFSEYLRDVRGIDVTKPLYRVEVQLRKKIIQKLEKNFWAGLCYYEVPDYSPESDLKSHHKWFICYAATYGLKPAMCDVLPHRRASYQNLFKVKMYDDFYQDSVKQFMEYDTKVKHLLGNDIYE